MSCGSCVTDIGLSFLEILEGLFPWFSQLFLHVTLGGGRPRCKPAPVRLSLLFSVLGIRSGATNAKAAVISDGGILLSRQCIALDRTERSRTATLPAKADSAAAGESFCDPRSVEVRLPCHTCHVPRHGRDAVLRTGGLCMRCRVLRSCASGSRCILERHRWNRIRLSRCCRWWRDQGSQQFPDVERRQGSRDHETDQRRRAHRRGKRRKCRDAR